MPTPAIPRRSTSPSRPGCGCPASPSERRVSTMNLGPARDPSSRAVAGRAAYLILHNTSEVVTPDTDGRSILRFPKGAVVFQDGHVVEVGPAAELSRRHVEARPINANGRLVTPGLVDCHTHMIFGGHRAGE